MDKWRAEEPSCGPTQNRLLVSAWWKLLAIIAVQRFHRKCVVLGILWKLSYARVSKKIFRVFSSNRGVFSVCGVGHSALQSLKSVCVCVCVCVCVEHGHTCIYTKLTFHLHHTQHSWSVFTALWYAGPLRGLGGPRANTKSGTHKIDCGRRVWGHAPKEILRFKVLWSVFWGLMRLFFWSFRRLHVP